MTWIVYSTLHKTNALKWVIICSSLNPVLINVYSVTPDLRPANDKVMQPVSHIKAKTSHPLTGNGWDMNYENQVC